MTATQTSKSRRSKKARRPRAADLSRKAPNQDRAKRTVARILAAASDILTKSGIDKLTMRRIASTAGVSVGVTYDYFPSKQAVLYRIYEARLDERLRFFDEAFAAEDTRQSFAARFEKYLELQREAGFPSRLDLELQNAIEQDEELERMTRHYEDELSPSLCGHPAPLRIRLVRRAPDAACEVCSSCRPREPEAAATGAAR